MATYKVVGIGQHGKFFDAHSYRDAIHYACNPAKAAYVGGAGITSIETAADEMLATAFAFGKEKGKKLRHSVLSFQAQECVTPEKARAFAEQIIRFYAPEFQIIYGVHAETDNVHIHLIMNQISFVDGHRYGGKKKDFYDFRNHMHKVTRLPVYLVKDTGNETNLYS